MPIELNNQITFSDMEYYKNYFICEHSFKDSKCRDCLITRVQYVTCVNNFSTMYSIFNNSPFVSNLATNDPNIENQLRVYYTEERLSTNGFNNFQAKLINFGNDQIYQLNLCFNFNSEKYKSTIWNI